MTQSEQQAHLDERIISVYTRIATAARRAGRDSADITLVAVSKTHSVETIASAIAAGLGHFGENRVQEAQSKISTLADDRPRLTWHLIGHLQRNKAKVAISLFDMVHSLDSLRLAETLNRHLHDRAADGQVSALPVLLQVNVSGEASKEGFDLPGGPDNPACLEDFAGEVAQILALPYLCVQGLMTIAPWSHDPEQARPVFRNLRRLRDKLARRFPTADWSQLSMGMTDDFEVAIEEGATLVRVGRAIFGTRASR